MRYLILVLFFLFNTNMEAKTVYFDGENGKADVWTTSDNGVFYNIYDRDLKSRVVNLSPGTYDIGIGESWDNTTERVLSWDMKITDDFTIYVSVDTQEGHRWLFYNKLNVDVGFHGTGILNGIGEKTNNGTWQRVTVDLDRDLQDTEPNNHIIRVNGMRFGGVLGRVDNITLDNPERKIYENGENGVANWTISNNSSGNATITLLAQDSDNDETRDNVISLSGDENDTYTIGGVDANSSGWNDRENNILQLQMRNNNDFTITVHVLTENGNKELVYTPTRVDRGMSADGLEIHHGLVISRNGDDASYGKGTDNRWQTYTIDLADDLHDYDPNNKLIAVNGITIQGNTLIDTINMFKSVEPNGAMTFPPVVYEDAEDGTINGWNVREGDIGDIVNVYDSTSQSRVIQLTGGGSYILGDLNGDNAWHDTVHKMVSWRMRTDLPYAIYVVVNTTKGLRHLFYTDSPNRGLLHGFDTGIHHGFGALSTNGVWRTVTRDLERDLKDAEPDNDLIEVNGFIYNGGDNGMIDDITLFNTDETIYDDGEHGAGKWRVSDNDPEGATITTIPDNDLQGRHLQGNVISLSGSGFDNAYMIGDIEGENSWNNRDQKILQWRFRNFGPEVEILDERGTIRDPNAFEFRIFVDTENGKRELVYTLGLEDLGLNGNVIHHCLGDDRIRGSVWSGDDPMNELGLWQTITRDLQQDINDFEPNNKLISINGFQVRNSGLVDDIKALSNVNIDKDNNISVVYEDAQDGTIDGWTIFQNSSGSATITNISDAQRGSKVIKLQGDGLADAYMLRDAQNNDWNNTTDHILEWSLNYSEYFTIYVDVQTTKGRRYIVYNPRDDDRGLSGEYILFGVGANIIDGNWHTITRDLSRDIESVEADNRLISINGMIIRGSGLIDDVHTLIGAKSDNIDDKDEENLFVYEDGEDENIDGWIVSENTSGTATITNIEDNEKNSRVIQLQGEGKADSYRLRYPDNINWNDTQHHNFQWSMNFSEDYTFYVLINTTKGRRYLTYRPNDDAPTLSGDYINIGLGSSSNNGTWQTFTRDLKADLENTEPDNEFIAIDSIIIRGSGRVDDIGAF